MASEGQASAAYGRRFVSAAAWGLITLGIALRIVQYAHNRSLWIDEACLALNIVGKTFSELAGPLDNSQNSPLAFLFVEKAITLLFGGDDWALRLFPLVCGILSVPVFYWLARRLAPSGQMWAPLIGLAFFASAKLLIYYASELRHYSTDVLLVCVLYLAALSGPPYRAGAKGHAVGLAVLGLVSVWFSLASIFVLAALGITHAVTGMVRGDRKLTVTGIALCGLWAGCFLVHLHIQNANIAARHMEQEIAVGNAMSFMPLPPTSVDDLKWFRQTFERMFYFPAGLTYLGLGGFAFLAGAIAVWKRNRAYAALLLLPMLFALLASGLHRYPFRDRFIFFLAPCLFLLIAEGIAALMDPEICRHRAIGLVLLLLLLAQPFGHGVKYLAHQRGGYEIKALLAHLKGGYRPGDVVYLPWSEQHPFLFYQAKYGLSDCLTEREPREVVLDGTEGAYRAKRVPELVAQHGRVWMLFGYDTAPPYPVAPGATDGIGRQREAISDEGATLYLYERPESAEGLPVSSGSATVDSPAASQETNPK